ncbi:Oxidoreductase [Steccherinum ochraceum]|uniref:Mitochondrial intermembrane space import and assembly protein 40 n=1 Tax=Steccherinum ochraceum TaxID=92696 RepID=A0A4R0S416_9APHY|nr:Oxidoreductase [Steccherinum ochraceum]
MVLGASAAVAYLTWKNQTIALDSVAPSKRGTPQTPPSSEPKNPLQGASTEAEPSTPTLHENHDASSTLHGHVPSETPNADDAEEQSQDNGGGGGAYDPVTGEINWDCPCLGGMAHGPCGLQFREAFSCFVYSEQEPKGIECVEKFKAMQDCFREHPDVYGDDIMDDDDEPSEAPAGAVDVPAAQPSVSTLQTDEAPIPSNPAPKKKVAVPESTSA